MAGLYLEIDGIEYKADIYDLKRKADVLDKYAERTEDGVMHREVIGTFYNYTLQMGCEHHPEIYDDLFDKLAEPVASHTIYLPAKNGKTPQTFEGYISSVQDNVTWIEPDGTTHYDGLSCNFTAMKPTRKA